MSKVKQARICNNSTPLPYDIVIEILTLLPVKSLSRFSCVSKSWNFTISSHQFSKTQLEYSRKASTLRRRLHLQDCTNGNFKHMPIDSLFNETAAMVEFVYPLSKGVVFAGSCNGIICLANDRINVVLWNPCIGKFKELPDFGFDSTKHLYCVYGFGFDVSCDDYKVVVFEVSSEYKYPERSVVMKIYSLKGNCWKRIGNCEFRPQTYQGSSAFANGKLYWTLEHERNYDEHGVLLEMGSDIVYFDLETEERGMLKQPNFVKTFDFSTINLVESKGCLYVYYSRNHDEEVWKVEGYGVGKEIWAKIATIDPARVGIRMYSFARLLYVGNNDEMVFAWGPKIVIFNKRECSCRCLEMGSFNKYRAGTYIESLISPLL